VRVHSEGQSRTLIFVAILASHAVLVYVMATSSTGMRPDIDNGFHSQPIYLIPFIEELPPIPKEKLPAPTIETQSYSTGSASIEFVAPQEAPDSLGTQSRTIDWTKEAEIAIQEMSQSKPGSQNFRDRPEEDPPSGKKPLGVFERKPTHRAAGVIEKLGPGLERRWLSERCYIEFGHLPDLVRGTAPRVNPVRCIMGSSSVDGDLFDHLKPGYLKRK
jgi:hypothetical protein